MQNNMKPLLVIFSFILQVSIVFGGDTFGYANFSEPSKEDLKYIYSEILPKPLCSLKPSLSMNNIFKLRPTMDRKGDRGPRGKDYWETFSKSHFYSSLTIQEDKKGIHNITFSSAFTKPSLMEVEKTTSWLLAVFGEPTEAYTRDLSKSRQGDELIALIWEMKGITIGYSLHYASGFHTSLRVCRDKIKTKDIFSISGRNNINAKSSSIAAKIGLWATSVANLKN